MDWRRTMRGTGRVLITSGVLILLFVAYQLWGTGLAEARGQRALRSQFEELTAAGPGATPPPSPSPDPGAPPGAAPGAVLGPPPPPEGAALAILRIPAIGVEKHVVEGVSLEDLKKAPGHYPETPMPGQPGNSAIAGHRTTYGAPFFNLDEVEAGDPIFVTTRQGSFRYEVQEKKVVKPTEVSVLEPAGDNRLTLTTCHPRFSSKDRLVVVATLIGEAAPPSPPAPSAAPGQPTPSDRPPADAPPTLDAGLSGESADRWPAILWGLLAAMVWAVTWAMSRRWRKWPAYALGTPVFLVVLFVFFENFSRLLPANF